MRNLLDEKYLHLVFETSLIIKAIIAFLEIIGGVVVFFVSLQFVLNLVVAVTQDERAEDPRDFIANYLLHSAQNFSLSAQHFAALFLLRHCVIKMFLIVGLLREKLLYYPTLPKLINAQPDSRAPGETGVCAAVMVVRSGVSVSVRNRHSVPAPRPRTSSWLQSAGSFPAAAYAVFKLKDVIKLKKTASFSARVEFGRRFDHTFYW